MRNRAPLYRAARPARRAQCFRRPWRLALLLLPGLIAVLPACGPRWTPEDKPTPLASDRQATPDGYYRVRRGDSLYTIAFRYGMDWRDLAAWNGISAPYTIYPDQEIRMSAPPGHEAMRTEAAPATGVVLSPAPAPSSSDTRDQSPPAAGSTADAVPGPASDPESEPPPGTAATASLPAEAAVPASAVATSTPASGAADDAASPPVASAPPPRASVPVSASGWAWPTEGRILSRFAPNDPARKGIDIAGQEGQPVVAAAAGQVVYSGSGLIGYGELVIVKHDERILSAYAHNRSRLVKEGDQVALGQQLAEMGRNDRNQALLHFEIRVNGVPTDPLKFLPGR